MTGESNVESVGLFQPFALSRSYCVEYSLAHLRKMLFEGISLTFHDLSESLWGLNISQASQRIVSVPRYTL
ncbi:hypothetical protein LguiA_012056 [Lonicera macranthoides]